MIKTGSESQDEGSLPINNPRNLPRGRSFVISEVMTKDMMSQVVYVIQNNVDVQATLKLFSFSSDHDMTKSALL